jgi:hypothetical protein
MTDDRVSTNERAGVGMTKPEILAAMRAALTDDVMWNAGARWTRAPIDPAFYFWDGGRFTPATRPTHWRHLPPSPEASK